MFSRKNLHSSFANKRFTLIELLVTVCVIAILIAMLLPATKSMLNKGDQMQCFAQAAMIGKSSATYAAVFGYTVDHLAGYNPSAGVPWGKTFFEDAVFCFGYKSDPSEDSSGLTYPNIQDLFHCPLDTTGGNRSYSLNNDRNFGRGLAKTIPMGWRGNVNPNDTSGPYNRTSGNGISGVKTGLHRNPSKVLLFCERWAYNNTIGGGSCHQYQRFTQGEFGGGGLQNPCIMFVDGHTEQIAPSEALALDYGNDLDEDY